MRSIKVITVGLVALLALVALVAPAHAQFGGGGNTVPAGTNELDSVETMNRTGSQAVIRSIGQGVSVGVQSALGNFGGGNAALSVPGLNRGFAGRRESGLSAGDGLAGFNGWTNGSYEYTRLTPSNIAREQESDTGTLVFGADTAIADRFIVGLSVAGSLGATDGTDSQAATFEQDTWSVAGTPYVAVILTENLYADLMAGYSYGQIDNESRNAAGGVSQSYSGQETDTWFGNVRLTYLTTIGNWGLIGSLGYSMSTSDIESVQSDQGTRVNGSVSINSQAVASIEAGREFTDGIAGRPTLPYLSLAYERDREIDGVGENGLRVTLGTDVLVSDRLTLTAEANGLALKTGQESYGGMVNVHVAF